MFQLDGFPGGVRLVAQPITENGDHRASELPVGLSPKYYQRREFITEQLKLPYRFLPVKNPTDFQSADGHRTRADPGGQEGQQLWNPFCVPLLRTGTDVTFSDYAYHHKCGACTCLLTWTINR